MLHCACRSKRQQRQSAVHTVPGRGRWQMSATFDAAPTSALHLFAISCFSAFVAAHRHARCLLLRAVMLRILMLFTSLRLQHL